MSNAITVQRLFTLIPEKELRIAGIGFTRPIQVGNNWLRIRIGMLCSLDLAATAYGRVLLMGMCASSGAPISSYSVGNFIGASLLGAVTGSTITYNAGAGNPYLYGATAHLVRKYNLSYAADVTGANALYLAQTFTGTQKRRTPVYVDITRPQGGSGAATVTVYGCSAATVLFDYRPDHFWQGLDSLGTPVINDQTLTVVATSAAVNISDLEGSLNSFDLFWEAATIGLDIYALGGSVSQNSLYAGIAGGFGAADETFEEYGTSTGSISAFGFLTGGSGWSAAGSIAYDVTNYNPGVAANSSNLAPQVYTQYVGTTNCPDDLFEQYATGTVNSGTNVSLGSYWSAPAYICPVAANLVPQFYVQLAGTNIGAFDTFEFYATNTQANPTTAVFDQGSLWASAGTIYYGTGADYSFAASANLAPLLTGSLAGTAFSPSDTFEQYSLGVIVSGVTLVLGNFWGDAGYIYTGTIG